MRQIFHDLCPPLLKRWYQRFSSGTRWSGDFETWEEAAAKCSGYQQDDILERVKQAALRVKAGEGIYERDSVVFTTPQYSWSLLSSLLYVAAINKGSLRVLDFGGSLGSTYVQYQKWINSLPDINWCVVEQEHFVQCGREHFEDNRLKFYSSISACMSDKRPDVVLFSGVLQYLPDPWVVLSEIIKADIDYIIIDRTGFTVSNHDRITIQQVPPEIYEAVYPCRFFSMDSLLNHLSGKYELVTILPTVDKPTPFADFLGLFFANKKIAFGNEISKRLYLNG